MKSKIVAGVLALLAGTLGIHKFYLGRIGAGLFYFLLSITGFGLFITVPLSIIEGLALLLMSQGEFDRTYNGGATGAAGVSTQQAQSIVVNLGDAGGAKAESVYDKIDKLRQLRDSGALTDDEFQAEKTKLLAGGEA